MTAFTGYHLLPALIQAIEAMGFTAFTPIQQGAIPPGIEGKDVLGSAQTGSGKTVAFVLPILNKILKDRQANPAKPGARSTVKALVIVPTRELAAQVEKVVAEVTRFDPVPSVVIIGGTSFHNQKEKLRKGAEIVVATPGRLLDHQQQRTISLKDVRMVVLDEADRMLDMGFIPDIRRILHSLSRDRQTSMFSATIPPEVGRIISEFMRDPVRVAVDPPAAPAEGISQKLYPIFSDQKSELLMALLKATDVNSALVFTRTKNRADRLARYLSNHGMAAAVLHADLSQIQRTRAMDAFRDKKHKILVATDIAARGIDVRHISHVINYDVPHHAEDYVHRVGRTGRAFTIGDAITLVGIDEEKHVIAIEKLIGSELPRLALAGFPYRVPPLLKRYKAPSDQRFRMRRTIARSSRMRFKR